MSAGVATFNCRFFVFFVAAGLETKCAMMAIEMTGATCFGLFGAAQKKKRLKLSD